MDKDYKIEIAGRELKVELNTLAQQSNGSAFVVFANKRSEKGRENLFLCI